MYFTLSGKMIHELIRVCKCGFGIRGRSGVSSDAMLMAVADRCVGWFGTCAS